MDQLENHLQGQRGGGVVEGRGISCRARPPPPGNPGPRGASKQRPAFSSQVPKCTFTFNCKQTLHFCQNISLFWLKLGLTDCFPQILTRSSKMNVAPWLR